MTIAVLGGRFDPPHWGHFWIAQQVLDARPDIDEVWMIPAFQHQWKACAASASDRLHMTALLQTSRVKVSDLEVKRGGISYSVDTVKQILSLGNHTVYWIVGSDVVSEFAQWEKKEELAKLTTFIVFPRDPYRLPPVLPPGFEAIHSPSLVTTNLSSTFIRNRIKKGESVRGFVSEGVEKYIIKKKLYQ